MRELTAIIGMHRSGTSMVAQLTHELGIPVVGDEDHLAHGNAHNQGGYWETPELVTMNNRLLAYLGGDWREVPAIPPGWALSPWLAPYRAHARTLIRVIPGERRSWKDPRLTLTLPFWRQVVPTTRYVLCFRNPLDVHRSLERRDNMSLLEAVRLWGLYSALAIRDTVGEPRLLLFYEDFFQPDQKPLDRLTAFLGVSAAGPDALSIQTDLRHHAHTSADLLNHPEVPDSVKLLWETLEHYRQGGMTQDDEALLNQAARAFTLDLSIPLSRRIRRRWRWLGGTVKMMTRERGTTPH
jgi:hypothetical protein